MMVRMTSAKITEIRMKTFLFELTNYEGTDDKITSGLTSRKCLEKVENILGICQLRVINTVHMCSIYYNKIIKL